jgi:hemoglobin/transferrin/lactoferrin receptor protein
MGERFGLGNFTIRGNRDNRLPALLDGVRAAEAYSFGPFLAANRDHVDLDGLKALEIVRGPARRFMAAEALGGVAAYRTKGAADYLFCSFIKAGDSAQERTTLRRRTPT